MPTVTLVVLSEDSGNNSQRVVERFAKKLLRHVSNSAQTHRASVEPTQRAAQQSAVWGNMWRSKSPRDRRTVVSLRRYLATVLAKDLALVFFHYDADVIWGQVSPTAAQFSAGIRAPVRQLLLEQGLNPDQVDACVSRLIEVVPHYSIEAWVYQNVDGLIAECARSHGSAHVALYVQWRADPGRLDDVDRPKHAACVGSRVNLELLEAFPWDRLFSAGKSFAHLGSAMRAAPEIRRVADAMCPAG